MWVIASQTAIDELNEAINDLWAYLAHLQQCTAGRPLDDEAVEQLWEITERISEALNTAVLWEQFA